MFNARFSKSLLSIALISTLISLPTFAAETAAKHHKHNVVNRESTKTKTDNGFVHTLNKTDDKGATASRRTEVARDKDAGTRTRTTSGTTFEGKTYNGENVSHKTENGYASQGHFTNSDGKVVDRSVDATIDKEANIVTKQISVTPEGGETQTTTRVRPLKRNGQ